MVGILHLAMICSAVCTLASTNSTCFDAAADLASGRTANTGPMLEMAFWINWRPAIGIAQCGSILTVTCSTSCPLACAWIIANFSYSVQSAAGFTIEADFFLRDFFAAGPEVSSSILLLSFLVDGSLPPFL